MGRAHSGDLRERVYGEIAGGGSRRAAARRFGVSPSTGVRLARRMAETGSLSPARQGRPPGGGKLAAHHDLLIRWVEADGDVTMPELAARLASERQVVAHPASLSRYLRRAGYTVKKCWQRTRPNARTWRGRGGCGGRVASPGCAVNRIGWCLWTRPARRPR